jgi:hypothetical protein
MFSCSKSGLIPVRLAPPVVCGAVEKMADTLYPTGAVLVIPFLISLKKIATTISLATNVKLSAGE